MWNGNENMKWKVGNKNYQMWNEKCETESARYKTNKLWLKMSIVSPRATTEK